ncbi:MAG: gliding motility-associated ABC transporter ATP-binding subunit GldA [Chitinophagaceae bacterium]|nr:gliding motility-associated ABC transporter ATP-binding subunit GldA [Chitinophagaceae bacterium]
MSIRVKNLLKTYGEQKAVNNISFTVNKGEIVGFLGPNGAGKSTTMKIVTGYLLPDAGEVSVCDINVAKKPLETKKKIGYLPESNPLYYDMYVREYIGFVAEVHKVKNQKAKIEDVIALTGLKAESKKKIGQLSKGYKQRVGLAAALIHDPEVLILDEPTSGLDPNQLIEIREVIRRLGENKTILFSSHILQEVQALCERVIIINKGELAADDMLANLQQSSTQHIKVSFREALEAEWLQRLPEAGTVNKIDTYTWQLETTNEEMLRRQLMELTLQHNLNIVSLQTGSNNLEEIFRSLTN